MKIGIQLALLPARSPDESAHLFGRLRRSFDMAACEIHLDTAHYSSAFRLWEKADAECAKALRKTVGTLGVHFPFLDLNPVSGNRRIAEAGMSLLEESMSWAREVNADYAVMHVRGRNLDKDQIAPWVRVVAHLQERAEGVSLCLENADDLHSIRGVQTILSQVPGLRVCVDIGHLHERAYPSSRLRRAALLLAEKLMPSPFTIRSGLPAGEMGGWVEVIRGLLHELGCIHIHNHDGRTAHRPFQLGRIDLARIAELRDDLEETPVIIEADYRTVPEDTLRDDLESLIHWLH